jgi:hypothetical protein
MRHSEQVLNLLRKQIGSESEVRDINQTAIEVVSKWVNPLSGGVEETNGLVYGLVQSGKTGVLSVTGAMGADEGYKTLIILTSDSDPLYDQTLGRVQEAFPGIDIIGKTDFKDADAFLQRIKGGTCAIVTTKNSRLLKTLIENFKKGGVKGLSCLIIDDEADQASRVMVMSDGFAWKGQTYDSLSKVAFAITGTRWNGPRFFGLRDKENRSATQARS